MTGGRRGPLTGVLERLERSESADGLSGVVLRAARQVTPTAGPLYDELRGRSLGHPLHAALTDLPVGLWVGAALLDLTRPPGHATAARRLVGLGVLSTVPTVVTGLTDYRALTRSARRVAAVHATTNGVGNALMVSSWVARRSGRQRTGVLLSTAGLAAAGLGALLGGHVALGMKEPAELP
ncbi:hypothetical protein BCE75_11827 [Isoptericola sp. CG 20/1183]|uniref:DUF2231 domain-containing protein n=1 Tax=Isoptericola halotolerans TaxID=300560 RepID=A0ABX5EC38_9MICO|nr:MULTISPECIES: DUF2231 domain-containing protein [Isoptericola]PRZ02653.1 hypothetical protein BCE75_11827 [Isoptericola sp. CG 20/1183]PRZ03005.1 hypothetical protein BCL65_11627 [Isoptericola halotolerans]